MGNHATADEAEVISLDKYRVSDAWANGAEFKRPFDYVLESTGQTCLIKRLDMGDLLKLGIAEELDFMTKELMTADSKKAESGKEAVSSAIMKASNFNQMEKMINLVVSAGVIMPKVHTPPLHDNARQKGLIYVDSIPFTDRMELFSVIFETEGLSTFRQEQEPGVADVADVPSVSLPADRPLDIRPEDT